MSQKPVTYERTQYRVVIDVPSHQPAPTTAAIIALLETAWPTAVVFVTVAFPGYERSDPPVSYV